MKFSTVIIGTSGIAARHIEALRKAGAEVKAVFSRSAVRAEEFAVNQNIPLATDDLNLVLQDDEISAAVITTEPSRHTDLAKRVLKAGKHILVEKPLDENLEKAEDFQELAAKSGLCVSVVSQYRFNPLLKEMKARLDEEGAGLAKTIYLGILWHRAQEYYSAGNGWRLTGSDFFLNQGIHWLDVLNWFFGEPEEVYSISRAGRAGVNSSDRSAAVLGYADGSLASVYGGSFADRNLPDQFVIHHENGCLDFQRLLASRRAARAWNWPWEEKIHSQEPDLFELQARDFIDSVVVGRPPETTVEHAVAALKLSKEITKLAR